MSLTPVGEKLFRATQSSFTKLNNELDLIEQYRNSPLGLVRISCGLQVIDELLIPKLAHFKERYPDIQLEFISDNQFVDILTEGYDAGVRLDNDVATDMIAVRISEPIKMAVIASIDYFQQHGIPNTIQELQQHHCISYRLTDGGIFQWPFNDNGKSIKFTPSGQWVFNDDYPTVTAVKFGLGIAYVPENLVATELENNRLIRVLTKQSVSLAALYLYYPHRNVSSALRVVIDSLKV